MSTEERESLRTLKAMAMKPVSPWGTDGGEAEKIYRQAQYILALEKECGRLRTALSGVREYIVSDSIGGCMARQAVDDILTPAEDAHEQTA